MQSQFTRILIGVDGRPGGCDALDLAARLARGTGAELTAVHVGHGARNGSPLDARPYEALLRHELAVAGVRAARLVIGHHSPGQGLRLAAERVDADLLVLGSSHRGRAGRVLAGDTLRGAMHGLHCAITVARRETRTAAGTWTIGVGFDGSPEARVALAATVELVKAGGGRIRLRAVGEPADRLLATVPGGGLWRSMDDQRRRSEAMIAAAVARLRADGVEADGDVALGFPADGLERLSAAVDLLVVGSRGYGTTRRLVLGDTADRLLHCAQCPVLVVPRGSAQAVRGTAAVAAA